MSRDRLPWICGGDSALSPVKPLGSGTYGDVYQMVATKTGQVRCIPLLCGADGIETFARKGLRCIGNVTPADIENEVRVISSLLEYGGHRNIVEVINHGRLDSWSNDYFIDMELCDLTLRDYMDYLQDKITLTLISTEGAPISNPPIFEDKVNTPFARIRNTWAIGLHIASGLEFLHRHKYVHRDLKPRNGTTYGKCLVTHYSAL